MARVAVRCEAVRWGRPLAAPIEGENERCIEWPLAMDALRFDRPGWIFDAGAACAPITKALPDAALRARVLHVTANMGDESEVKTFRGPRLSYLSADLRDLRLFADQSFVRVGCLSTLEHIGADNSSYGAPVEDDPDSMWQALRELWRITKSLLFLTVPLHDSGAHNGRWRFLTRTDITRIGIECSGAAAMIRYYWQTAPGWWHGGSPDPAADCVPPPDKVQQIAVLMLLRV